MEIDQIFVGIHVRCARLVSSLVPRPVRSLLQLSSLLLSLFLLTSLIWLHHQHIHPQGTHYQPQPQPQQQPQPQPPTQSPQPPHLSAAPDPSASASASSTSSSFASSSDGGFPSLVDWMQGSDVLRVVIEPPSADYGVWQGTGWAGWWSDRDRIVVSRDTYHADESAEDVEAEAARAHGEREDDRAQLVSVHVSSHPSAEQSAPTLRYVSRPPPNFSSSPALIPRRSTYPSSSPSSAPSSLSPSHVYEYAHHKGYFLLPSSLYARHRVVTTVVTLSASHRAFGPPPLSLVTYHLFGYDSIILNHLIRQMRHGFMRNVHTNDMYTLSGSGAGVGSSKHNSHSDAQMQQPLQPLSNSTATLASPSSSSSSSSNSSSVSRLGHLLYLLFFKSELLVTTLFLFFATTTLVSSTLTQTQLRMLHFTDQLRQHIRLHLPIVGLVLEHTMQSLSTLR